MKIAVKKNWLLLSVLMYIDIAMFVFLMGFVKIVYSILIIGVVSCVEYEMYKKYVKIDNEKVEINIYVLMVVVIIVTMLMYHMGYGGFEVQSGDWYKHNTIMKDLVNYDWPVYYRNQGEHAMLCYYIGQYMVPALVGKILGGYRYVSIITWIWTEMGVVLVYLYIIYYIKIKKWYMQLAFLYVFLFFMGLQAIGKGLLMVINSPLYEDHINFFFWTGKYQYSSNYVLIKWVFNQTIVVWLSTLMFLEYKDNIKYYVIMVLPCMLFGAFSFLGLAAVMLLYAMCRCVKDRKMIKDIFSYQNIIVFLTLGSALLLYFYGNVLSEKPEDMSVKLVGYNIRNVYFILWMVVPYIVLLYNGYKKSVLYYIVFGCLLVIPTVSMGKYNDFMMRVSIPSLFVVMLMVIKIINDEVSNKRWIAVLPLIICILLGSITPIKEALTKEKPFDKDEEMVFDTMARFADRSGMWDIIHKSDYVYNYFAYDIDDNLFYKYIARTKDKKYKTIKSGKVDTSKRK